MKFIILIILSLCIFEGVAQKQLENISIQDLVSHNKWKFQFKKQYFNDEESSYRQILFLYNLQKINKHNSNQDKEYEKGVNQFSDMTKEEFVAVALNPTISTQQTQKKSAPIVQLTTIDPIYPVNLSLDWRNSTKLSPVKNQGMCGSCWAFSTTGLLESINALRGNNLTLFSEQELVDCTFNSTLYRSYGCNGGSPYNAHQYVKNLGISSSKAYPYVGKTNPCQVNSTSPKVFKAGSSFQVKTNNGNLTNKIQYTLKQQPLSVLVDASRWNSYSSGVLSSCTTSLNHAVLLVGYTSKNEWIVKNSWGTYWGQKGYIYLAPGNTCNIQAYVMGSTI